MSGLNQEFCEILITCFAHFLWQGLLLGAAFEVLMWTLKNRSPQSRHACGLFCLLIFSLCVPMTYLVVRNSDIPNPELAVSISDTNSNLNEMIPFKNEQPSQIPALNSESTVVINDTTTATDQPWDFRRAAPLLLGLYFAGVLFFACRLAMGVYIGRSYRQHAMPVTQPEFIASIEKVTRQVGLAIKPPVMWCQQVAVPSVVGILKPTVLLPLACLTQLQPAQLEQILIHELTHIRRYDHLFNLAQNVLEAVLFFHPVVWFISRRVRLEREFCCDAAVVASGNIAEEYANSLIDVAQLSQSMKVRSLPVAVPAVEKPSKLGIRIDRILGRHQRQKNHLFETGSLITVATVLGICCLFAVQLPSVADSNDNKSTTENLEAVLEATDSPNSINNKKSMNVSELRAAYLKQVNSINDIEVHYTNGHSSGGRPVMRKWYRSGNYFRHLENTSRHRQKQKTNQPEKDKSPRLIESGLTYDEIFYYNLRLENGVTKKIQVMDSVDPIHKWNLYPEAMIGSHISSANLSLSEVLSISGARVVGKVMVGGSECWEVKSSPFNNTSGDTKIRLHVFFDPSRDYLPRRILVLLDSTDFSNGNQGKWFYDLEIIKFSEVKDGHAKNQRWFPSKAIIRQAISNEITQIVKHVSINQGIDKKFFTPAVQEKTDVLDATTYGEGKVIRVNSQKEFDLFIERLSIEQQIEELKKEESEQKTADNKTDHTQKPALSEIEKKLIGTWDSSSFLVGAKMIYMKDRTYRYEYTQFKEKPKTGKWHVENGTELVYEYTKDGGKTFETARHKIESVDDKKLKFKLLSPKARKKVITYTLISKSILLGENTERIPKKADSEKTKKISKPTLEFRIAQKESGEGLIETKVEDTGEIIYMHKSAFITDADINFAKVTKDNSGSTAIQFELTPEAAKTMRETSKENIGKRLVVIIEGKVLMAPSINAVIHKTGIISGSFTEKEAERIVKAIWPKTENKTLEEKLKHAGMATISGRIVMPDMSPATVEGEMYYTVQNKNGRSYDSDLQKNDQFSIVVPAGKVWMTYFPKGYSHVELGPFNLKPGEKKEDIKIVLDSGISVKAIVGLSIGNPIPGATVRVYPFTKGMGGAPFSELTTNSDGECQLEHLINRSYYNLYVTAPGYLPLFTAPLRVFEGQELLATMVRSIPGTAIIRFADGTPAPFSKLYIKREITSRGEVIEYGNEGDAYWGKVFTKTDGNGRFKMNKLETGSQYLFIVEAVDGARGIVRHLKAGQVDMQITLPRRRDLFVRMTGDINKLPQINGKPFLSMRQKIVFEAKSGKKYTDIIGADFPIEYAKNSKSVIFRGLAVDLGGRPINQQVEVMIGNDEKTKKIADLNLTSGTVVEFDLTKK